MKKKKIIYGFGCILLLMFSFIGCSQSKSQNQSTVKEDSSLVMFSKEDKEVGYDESKSIILTLSDDGISSTDQSTLIKENTVTISKAGTYILTGELSNGQVIVDADENDTIQIVLKNVKITNDSSAALYVKQADKVVLTLAEESKNSLFVTGEYEPIDDNNIDSVIFSKEDLTLNGNGSLSINAKNGNGITSKKDLIVTSGAYTIEAKNHGMEGKDSVRIANGEFDITSGKDGIHSENSKDTTKGFVYIAEGKFQIESTTDAIDGVAYVLIDNGSFNITTNGGSKNATVKEENNMPFDFNPEKHGEMPGKEMQTQKIQQEEETESAKGLKADGTITIHNGSFTLNTLDDAIHAKENILIEEGVFEISTGDDGIHADANLTIEDGEINIINSYEGLEGQGLDIKGGTITLCSSDDGLNASGDNAYIKISGGNITIHADGDGVDSNGTIVVSGGETYVSGPVDNANAALDYNETAEISGGIFIAAGSSGMAQNFGDASKQGTILVFAQSGQNSNIILKDSMGNELVTYTPDKEYSSVLISAPCITKGETYTVVMGDETQTVEMTSLIYGSSKSFENMGGKRPDFDNKDKVIKS